MIYDFSWITSFRVISEVIRLKMKLVTASLEKICGESTHRLP